MGTFETATETFLLQATWLGDDDLPAVVALREAAKELDSNGVQAALLNTYGVTYRNLMKRRAGTDYEVDPLEALLG